MFDKLFNFTIQFDGYTIVTERIAKNVLFFSVLKKICYGAWIILTIIQ